MRNDTDEHRTHSANGPEEHMDAFDGHLTWRGVARPSTSARPRSSLLQHLKYGIETCSDAGLKRASFQPLDSVLSAPDTAEEYIEESPFSDQLSDDETVSYSAASLTGQFTAPFSESDDDSDDDDHVRSHCNFLETDSYAFHRARPQTPTRNRDHARAISFPRPTNPARRRAKLSTPLSATPPSTNARRIVKFVTPSTKHFSPTAPVFHIGCAPHVPHPSTDTPSRLRDLSLYKRRHSNAYKSLQVRFKCTANYPPREVEPGKGTATLMSSEVIPPFALNLEDAAQLEDLLEEIQAQWPTPKMNVEAVDGGEVPIWPLKWIRYRLVEDGEKGLVDAGKRTRLGGFKRWLTFNKKSWQEWERALGEYQRLLGVWRMAAEERVESLKKRNEKNWWNSVLRRKDSGKRLRRRFAKGNVTPVVEMLWE